jgi:hypothetical protein
VGKADLPADFAVIEALTAAMAEPRSEFKRGAERISSTALCGDE